MRSHSTIKTYRNCWRKMNFISQFSSSCELHWQMVNANFMLAGLTANLPRPWRAKIRSQRNCNSGQISDHVRRLNFSDCCGRAIIPFSIASVGREFWIVFWSVHRFICNEGFNSWSRSWRLTVGKVWCVWAKGSFEVWRVWRGLGSVERIE
jgi:hypothetical protein